MSKKNSYSIVNTNKNYTYKGNKDVTILPEFVDICKKTQEELVKWLPNALIEAGYTDVITANGYIYAKGNIPVLLTAHMDTVHSSIIKTFYEDDATGKHILSSPQGIGGDDRCGIYMILEIIKTHKCSVLFCEDEEIGGVGSREFCKTCFIDELSQLNYLIELDRANANDAVFYDCDNPEFTNFIIDNTGYNEAYGSFSDISYLAPACKVAAVNLSCGYYNAHTLGEIVVIEDMLNTIEIVKNLLEVECEQFEYVECKYNYYGLGNYYNYNRFLDNDYEENYYNKKNNITIVVYINDYEETLAASGKSFYEAFFNIFKENPNICYNDILDYELL